VKVETVQVGSLERDPENARKHSKKNIEAIAGSLAAFGQRRPLVLWGNIVIAGNGTLEAAESLGWSEIQVTRVPPSWSAEQARAYSLADNRTGELAEWEPLLLADQLIELDAVGFEVGDWGFEPLTPPLEPEPDMSGPPKTVTCPDCGLDFVPEK
jgi:ParB-like chromosome segregation protein Spo0J